MLGGVYILVYLDNCSFNRPWDNQQDIRIRLETEAKLYIQNGIRQDRYSLLWSYMLDFENSANPYEDKRNTIAPWKGIAAFHIEPSEPILLQSREIASLGIQHKDAIHLACAIAGRCEYFITTDDKLTNKAVPGIRIVNPIDFVRETEDIT